MLFSNSLAISLVLIAFLIPHTVSANDLPPVPEPQQFIKHIADLKNEFVQSGVDPQIFDKFIRSISYKEGVIESDRNQPESKFTLQRYLSAIVSPQRIKRGKAMMKKHRKLLQATADEYGVPPHVLVAFWGIESFYGTYTGKVDVPSALATLSFDKRRQRFFQNQLLHALLIASKGNIPLENMKGSWAGAMGHMQFMPSTYYQYAADGDNDQKIDLWNSLPDIFGSAGSYLKAMGWHTGEKSGRPVQIPENFEHNFEHAKTVSEWKKIGLKNWNGEPLPESSLKARVILLGEGVPAFLAYHNFDVILRWNRSNLYAIAVGLLSEHFAGTSAVPSDFSQPF